MPKDNNNSQRMGDLAPNQLKRRGLRGFTLSEVFIALAIVAILTALTYPQFTDRGDTTLRVAAQSEMRFLALALERDFTLNDAYTDLISEGEFSVSPNLQQYYELRIIPENNGSDYTILADPIGIQTRDDCGTLQLNSRGVQLGNHENCWD